jgi:hypothetical protein
MLNVDAAYFIPETTQLKFLLNMLLLAVYTEKSWAKKIVV